VLFRNQTEFHNSIHTIQYVAHVLECDDTIRGSVCITLVGAGLGAGVGLCLDSWYTRQKHPRKLYTPNRDVAVDLHMY
jgi:hypothetical protein